MHNSRVLGNGGRYSILLPSPASSLVIASLMINMCSSCDLKSGRIHPGFQSLGIPFYDVGCLEELALVLLVLICQGIEHFRRTTNIISMQTWKL